MGVTGLWTVVAPTARPTKLETLNRKRLAVDASIWIYQFLKAVRDKEGNALRNSHVVGFFRRICKLLYFGIKPVFVFDGGAPTLKRETIRTRARRREGRRDDAARTAGKLLAVQVARAAEDEAKRQREAQSRDDEDEAIPEDQELVYVDEIGMNQQQRQQGRGFKRQDQYHLPDLNVSLEEMGAPNDPRVMSQAELEAYAKHFHSGEDVNLYDFSKIDFDSPFFVSLPAGDKYNILNAARLRSRLRMGYSKDQLDGMFPDRMAFSRFQIERVKERNELTQRLMSLSGMTEGDWNLGGRIAGERGAEYVLVRNEGVEGGWALGVVSNKKGSVKDNAIDLDQDDDAADDERPSDDEDFEDVAIEGVNRIPQTWKRKRRDLREIDYDITYEEAAEKIAKKRKAVYGARQKAAEDRELDKAQNSQVPPPSTVQPESESLAKSESVMFVEQDQTAISDDDEVFEDVAMTVNADEDDDDDELQRAIAMSMEQPQEQGEFILEERPTEGEDEDKFDLQAALAESSDTKYRPRVTNGAKRASDAANSGFGGPLPFESLNLGQSLLGRKKAKKAEEDLSGGFDRKLGDDAFRKHKQAQPMPEWFDELPDSRPHRPGDMDTGEVLDSQAMDEQDRVSRDRLELRATEAVIDLEEKDDERAPSLSPNRDLEAEKEDWEIMDNEEGRKRQDEADAKAVEALDIAESRRKALEEEREKRYALARDIAADDDDAVVDQAPESSQSDLNQRPAQSNFILDTERTSAVQGASDEDVEWSESDTEAPTKPSAASLPQTEEPAGGRIPDVQAADPIDEDDDLFEDVEQPLVLPRLAETANVTLQREPSNIDPNMFLDDDDDENKHADRDASQPEAAADNQQEFLADDSDEELMRQLANEAEEHLRFTNELNPNSRPKSPTQAMRDYENELKQLRNQQKKDRRDADEVTQTMIQECQALLRLFGLPYITAPMEAEAQCAELVHLGLVDGIVTDDSDIFLFGGTRIYKNMFNAAKFVECYISKDLEKEYALDRQKLIRFAHLLGSDYTEGIPGIGPVTALEIISDFPDLIDFKDWTLKVQLGIQTPSAMEGLLTTAFRRKFKRTVQKKLFLPTTFPDLRVDKAYLDPEVDDNPEDFQWGVPDLDKLRSFLMATIGWSQERTDEVLVPVIRDMNKREVDGVQSNLTRYFTGGAGVGPAPVRGRGINGYNGPGEDRTEGTAPRNRTGKESGRMKNAYTRLRGEAEKKRQQQNRLPPRNEVAEEAGHEITDPTISGMLEGGQANSSGNKNEDNEVNDEPDEAQDDSDFGQKMKSKPKAKPKTTRKRKAKA